MTAEARGRGARLSVRSVRTVQCGTARHSAAQYNPVRHNTAQYDTVRRQHGRLLRLSARLFPTTSRGRTCDF